MNKYIDKDELLSILKKMSEYEGVDEKTIGLVITRVMSMWGLSLGEMVDREVNARCKMLENKQ